MSPSRVVWIRVATSAVFLVPVLLTVLFELAQDDSFDMSADWLGIILPVFFASFLIPSVWVLTRRAHHAWQFRDAPLATASLVSATATGDSGSGTERFELRAEVFPEGSPSFHATMVEFVNLGQLPQLVPGAELEVAYLPDERITLKRILTRPVTGDQMTAAGAPPPESDKGLS